MKEFKAFLTPELAASSVKRLVRTPVLGCVQVPSITQAHQHVFGVLNRVRARQEAVELLGAVAHKRDSKGEPYSTAPDAKDDMRRITRIIEEAAETAFAVTIPNGMYHRAFVNAVVERLRSGEAATFEAD